MKQLLIALILCFTIGLTSAQTATKYKAPKTEQELTKTATKSIGEQFTYKGKDYSVYVGSRGGKFIVIINSKGETIKHYLPKLK